MTTTKARWNIGKFVRLERLYQERTAPTRELSIEINEARVALGRLEKIYSGETLSAEKAGGTQIKVPEPPEPVYGVAIGVKDRKDEVKLTGALGRLMEEDPSLRLEHAKDTHQMVLWGQGEMHLRVALERLKRKYGVEATSKPRQLPYKETIKKGIEIRGRHKKQSGGHGQFGDVVLDIKPLPRGSGFQFDEKITGGVVPRSFIPSVEIGVSDFLQRGTLGGFPVVDVAVTLTDGSPNPGTFSVSKKSVELSAASGTVETVLNVNLPASEMWSVSVSPANQKTRWLTVTPTSGKGPAQIKLIGNTTGLANGAYSTTLLFQSENTVPQIINVPVVFAVGN
jgi:translation elongation factor EF-G